MFESLGARQVPGWFRSHVLPTLSVRDALAGTSFGRGRAALVMFAPALGAAPYVRRRAGALKTWNAAATG